MKTEDYSCRICGSEEFSLKISKKGFDYVKCPKCDVVRHYPYPSKAVVDSFYNEYLQYKKSENPFYLSDESWESVKNEKNLTFKDLGLNADEFAGRKVLDVGCATGLLIKYMNMHKALTYGIDIQPELINAAKEKGLNCEVKNLFEVQSSFEIINMSHVIEHVDDPVMYIKHIHSLLVPSGYFILETPCTGIISETFEEDWRFYMPVEHLHLFSQKSLFRILNENGFAVVRWIRYGSGNDSGTINPRSKKVADTIAKKFGIGDTISILCRKS